MLVRLALIACAALAAACSGSLAGGAAAPTSSHSAPAGSHAPAPATPADRPAAPADWDDGAAAESAADAAPGSAYSARQPAPRPTERPGLGTVFGETVGSQVRVRPFTRATAAPFATVALHYNDAEGVRAHAAYLGSQLEPFHMRTPAGGLSVALTDAHGATLPGALVAGRALIAGVEGQRYNLVIHNHTGGRYELVASVDGLDVVDGRPAHVGKRGYILEPYGTVTVDGFRRSHDTVAAFRFGRVSQSYAARTSGDRNVGVIGVAFFAEHGSDWTSDELYRRDTANPFPGNHSFARPPH